MTTSTTETATSDSDRYLSEVAPHLAALTADERTDLLDDLAQHLREIAAEPGPPLRERLGPPAAYAAELLATAGVEVEGRPRPTWAAAASAMVGRLRSSTLGREAARAWPALRPAWWVARAYLAVSLLTAMARDASDPGFPVPELFGSAFFGLVAILVAIPLSIRLGQRHLGRTGRTAVIVANVVLAVFAVALFDRAANTDVQYLGFSDGPSGFRADGCLRAADGEPITNLYPYDSEGRLLDTVLLYDQLGRPVDNLCVDYDSQGRRLHTEYRRDANGASVINAFPRRQATPTGRPYPQFSEGGVAPTGSTVPVNPPPVVVPRLAPPTTLAGGPTTTAPPPSGQAP